MIHEWKFLWKLWKNIQNCVTFLHARWLERGGEIYAYPNQVVELAEPIVEQFVWVVRTLWHFAA